jgi:hypothetical protein
VDMDMASNEGDDADNRPAVSDHDHATINAHGAAIILSQSYC